MTDKYLVFRLERWQEIIINEYPRAVYEDRLVPCFELVKEFDVVGECGYQKVKVEEWAEQYSSDNRVRTFVVKGSVFGG